MNKSELFMKQGVFCISMIVSGMLFFCSCEEESVPGHITENTSWSGNVTVTGDVVVDKGVTLTIKPGTIVTVMADQDDQATSFLGEPDDLTRTDPTADPDAGGTEYHKSHISIVVLGRISCKGTAGEPIVFKSSKPDPFYTDWVGITVNEGEFEYTLVEWCINGIYSLGDFKRLTIENCHVRHIWAAGTGFNPGTDQSVAWIKHTTIEDCGHEAIDTHSPKNLELAYNVIKDSQVGFNLHDDMNANVHHNLVLNTTIPFLAVHAKEVFATHCTFQAAQVNTGRWTYQGWTMPQLAFPSALLINASDLVHVIFTNSIIFDSPKGIIHEAAAEKLVTGYLNMDNVPEPWLINASQGAGCLYVNSGFVNKQTGDFRLSPSSSLKAKGNPADGSPDLGAFGGTQARETLGWIYN